MLIAISYLLGGIPFGWIIAKKVKGIDIRKRGSGNIGATNVARHMGRAWGFLTLALDVSKGFIPVFIGAKFLDIKGESVHLVGLFAVLGHQFSIYQGMRGGKGVATALGVFFALTPLSALISLCVFIISVVFSGYISFGSISGAISLPISLLCLDSNKGLVTLSIAVALLIIGKHTQNIKRLLRGEELSWREEKSHLRSSSRRSSSSSE